MKKFIETEETDWMKDFGVLAINRISRIFENTSSVKGNVIEIYYGLDENQVSNVLGQFLEIGADYEYALYTPKHELCGFCYWAESVPEGQWELPVKEVSYGELYELSRMFDKELIEKGVTLCDEDYRTEAFNDYVEQYQNGRTPSLNLLYDNRHIQCGTLVKFKNPIFGKDSFEVTQAIRPGEEMPSGETNNNSQLIYILHNTDAHAGVLSTLFALASELTPLV